MKKETRYSCDVALVTRNNGVEVGEIFLYFNTRSKRYYHVFIGEERMKKSAIV